MAFFAIISTMFDARTFPLSLDTVRNILQRNKADFKGDYVIHDKIFNSKDTTQTLDKIFLRLRHVSKNIWKDKSFIVTIKNTEIKKVGKQSIIPVKKDFDTEREAQKFIHDNYSDQFEFSYEFDRIGEQYFLSEEGIDLEDVQGHPSIEFKSPTEEGLQKLLTLFNVNSEDVIKGPSVVAIKKILQS